jgi:hypothetical protein
LCRTPPHANLFQEGAMLVRFSTHYYVISLSRQTTALFEAFRDTLIDVQNHGFPVRASTPAAGAAGSADQADGLHAFLRIVDECFGHYYELEPMILVVAGEKELQAAFTSVTTHPAAIVGRVDGDFSTTSQRDLGRIVWPVVKEAMSGSGERALRDLENTADAEKICGLETVGRRVNETVGATLLVEEDYHVRGSISEADGSAAILPSVDVRDEIDDVIDMLIEKVLGSGGNVVFVPSGSLSKLGRIVLLLRGVDGAH